MKKVKNFTGYKSSIASTPNNSQFFCEIMIDGRTVFVPDGTKITWHELRHAEFKSYNQQCWATISKTNSPTFKEVKRIYNDSSRIKNNGSYDHFLQFKNIENGEIRYGGTTVGSSLYDYWEVTEETTV
jgi:hypothetical protein